MFPWGPFALGHWVSRRHETQRPIVVLQKVPFVQVALLVQVFAHWWVAVLHCCPAVVQSVLPRHATQVFVAVSHWGAAVVVQSLFWRHPTQVFVAVLHAGVLPPQSALVAQPATH
jgi:hypothetical protein